TAPATEDQARTLPGEVHIYSGKTGKELRHWAGSQPGELYGRMIVDAGDLDGDGVDDMAIGAPWHRRDSADRVGRVEFRSGKSGRGPGGPGGGGGGRLVRRAQAPAPGPRRPGGGGAARRAPPPPGRRQGGGRRPRSDRAAPPGGARRHGTMTRGT